MAKYSETPQRVAIAMILGWIGWGLWLQRLTKAPSAARLAGLVIVGLLLLICSLDCIKELGTIVATLLAGPFVIAWLAVEVCIRAFLVILSPICVINPRSFSKSKLMSKGDYCKLCYKCDRIIESANILLGSPWGLTFPVKKYDFYNQSELLLSATGCHLCYLLSSSVVAFTGQDHSDQAQINEPTQNRGPDPDVEARTRGYRLTNSSRDIMLEISKRVYLRKHPVLQIQLCGAVILNSKPINIAWVAKGISAMP